MEHGKTLKKYRVAWLLSLWLFSLASLCQAQDYRGLSAFASTSPKYPCDKFLDIVEHAKQPAMAILFGTQWSNHPVTYDCAYRFMNKFKNRPHLLLIHFSNEAGRRKKGGLGSGDFLPGWSRKRLNLALERGDPSVLTLIRERSASIRGLFEGRTNQFTLVILSAGLEDNYSQEAAQRLIREIRTYTLNSWLISRNPCSCDHSLAGADLREYHSLTKKSGLYLINEDGNYNLSTKDSFKSIRKHRGAVVYFVWRGRHQGRLGNKFIPRFKRKYIIPNRDVLELSKLMKEKSHVR